MENKNTKLLLGKILGEIYRVQYYNEKIFNKPSEANIYGLLNGIEYVVDSEIDKIGFLSREKFEAMIKILDEYFINPEKLKKFEGYRDIEPELEENSISRSDAIIILTYLYADRRFVELIDKMDTGKSPMECRRFELDKWDI